MKRTIVGIIISWLSLTAYAQKINNHLKFDFGNGKAAKGYIPVSPQTIYTEQSGYGFHPGASLQAIDRGGKDVVTGTFITSNQPFLFSVQLPEGNYDVKLLLGDVKGTSATTIRTECRRLMGEHITTAYGKTITQTFTIHIRDSMIRDSAGNSKVRLKPREVAYLHWDNRLTIEFNDSLPKVCALEIIPNKTATTVFLAGNSTVVDQDKEPWAAWGQMIPRFFQSGKVAIGNYAESGETLKSFNGAKRLQKLWSMAKPGDYLLIEFAHNDQKPGGNHLDPFTTYKATLKEWIAEARRRKVIPVLVTSMHRRNFDSTGRIVNTLGDYPAAVRATGAEEKVTVIDLNAMSKILYEAWGPEASIKAFVHYPANTFPGQTTELKDNTHFSTYGAYELAKCVVKGIQQNIPALSRLLMPGLKTFDPAQPDPIATWYWPLSGRAAMAKPDGN
jgi:lysophospholipase L1-like esterase